MHAPLPSRGARALVLVLVLATVTVAGCDASPTPSPTASSTASAAPSSQGSVAPIATASPDSTSPAPSSPSETSAPPSADGRLLPGMLAVTVSDGLRVRSAPRVADDSLKYRPVLPVGTQLVVAAGPVNASGFDWYRVAPIGVKLSDNADQGWVAVADHDGTPWVAPAKDPTPGFELVAANLQRPKVDVGSARAEADDINAFALDLYKRLRADAGNDGLVFSPTSIVMALAMARAGARGETATEMDRLIHAGSWSEVASGVGSLDVLLRSRDATWHGDEDETRELALRIANMAFAQDGFELHPEYLDRIGRMSGSGLGLVDYENHPEDARKAINGWVSRQTMGRIPELLGPTAVTPSTRLTLVNAVYLKAQWARPFDADMTTPRPFTTLSGSSVRVPTMELWGDQDVGLAKGRGWTATELAYMSNDNHPLAMTLILPDDLAAFERSMTPQTLATIRGAIRTEERRIAKATFSSDPMLDDCGTYPYAVHLFMPKFGEQTKLDTLVDTLIAMGMRRATAPGVADFTGITSEEPLYIARVIHQANIDVDEKGTVAAAATAIGMDTGGCTGPQPAKIRTLRLNRPFIYLLRDTQSGAILFMGRVTDPR
jgi:serine protease inhibitor